MLHCYQVVELHRVLKKFVPYLYGCCGGAVASFVWEFTQLHRPGLNLNFETLIKSVLSWLLQNNIFQKTNVFNTVWPIKKHTKEIMLSIGYGLND